LITECLYVHTLNSADCLSTSLGRILASPTWSNRTWLLNNFEEHLNSPFSRIILWGRVFMGVKSRIYHARERECYVSFGQVG